MSESRNVVIVTGIPGVGKTTVINTAVEIVKQKHGENVLVLNFGTEMFEVASKAGQVKSRDEMRKMPTSQQRENQKLAGQSIAEKQKLLWTPIPSSRQIMDT
jgi:adenylate kinase